MSAGRRSTRTGSGTSVSQQLAGKLKANEVASTGDCMGPANRRAAPGAGSFSLPATSVVTGEQAASCSRQIGPSGVKASYAAVLCGSVTPSQPSGTFDPTTMDSDSSESGVSMEISERRMSQDLSGPLSSIPEGTTDYAHVANGCLQQDSVLTRSPFLYQG